MKIWNGKHKGLKRTLMILLALGILGGSIVFGGSAFVKYGMKQYIYEETQMSEIPEADCILVLGAGEIFEAYGIPAEDVVYGGQWVRDFRENFARTKDVVYNLFQQKPTYLGEKISIHGDASATDD